MNAWMRREPGEWACLLTTVIAAGLVAAARYGTVVYYWDESFIVYDAWRVSLGEIPNWDYVSGYMGAQALLIAAAFKVFGTSMNTYHGVMAVTGVIFGVVTHLSARTLVSPPAASFAALLALLGYLQWWYLNPGLSVEIFMLAAWICLSAWLRGRSWRWIAAAGVLCGLALCFKQSAVFIGVGTACVIAYARGNDAHDWRTRVVATFPAVLLFCVYVVARLGKQGAATWDNYLVLLPWLVCVVWLIGRVFVGAGRGAGSAGPEVPLRDFAAFGAGVMLGLSPLAIWYVSKGADLGHVLRETFVRIPGLVDRGHAPFGEFSADHARLMGAALLIPLAYRLTPRGRFLGVVVAPLVLVLFCLYCVLALARGIFGGAAGPNPVVDRYLLALWRGYLWWAVLFVPVMLWTVSRRRHLPGSAYPASGEESLAGITLFGSAFMAIAFPWPTHMYVVAVAMLMYVAMCREWAVGANPSNPRVGVFSRLLPYLSVLVACLLLAYYQLRVQAPMYLARVDHPRFHGQIESGSMPYVELARAIENLPEGDSVYGHPNLAFAQFLAGRRPQGVWSHFLGLEPELDQLAEDLRARRVTWIVVASDDYGALFYINAGFPGGGALVRRLGSSYQRSHSVGRWDFYRRVD